MSNEQPNQPEQNDTELAFLNAELATLLEQEKEKQEREATMEKDGVGNARKFQLPMSHEEIHATTTGVKMLFQMCSMALLHEKERDEQKQWKAKLDILLEIQLSLANLHATAQQADGNCDDDDDDNCDHDH
jgi:hypothetical protein